MKKTVVFIIIVVLIAGAGYIVFGSPGRIGAKSNGAAVNVTGYPRQMINDSPVNGMQVCSLFKGENGDAIELYADDSAAENYNSDGLSVVAYQIVKTNGEKKEALLTYKRYLPKDKRSVPVCLPVTDMLISDDIIKMIVQDNRDIFYIERALYKENENTSGKKRRIYIFKWIPSLNAGRLLDASFMTPDVIRLKNSTGAEYDVEIVHNEKGLPIVKMIWDNGQGESFTGRLLYAADKPVVSPDRPVYPEDSLAGHIRMDAEAKRKMLEELDKNADILKVEDGPTEFPDDISVIKFP